MVVFSTASLLVRAKYKNLAVLVLAFVQPFLILYFVYWRSRRLDVVIKLFAVGFWFTTFQSVILEELLSLVVFLVFGLFVMMTLQMNGSDGDSGNDNSNVFGMLM